MDSAGEQTVATHEETEKYDGVFANPSIVIVFLIGLALIVAGFLVDAFMVPTTSDPADIYDNIAELGSLLLKELGVAFLVAAIIGAFVERRARERDNRRAARLRREIADHAIFAIYGLRHSKEFINATIQTNLQAPVVRRKLEMEYRVRALTESEAALIPLKDALQRFVILEMRYKYEFVNVSSDMESLTVHYSVPMREGAGARELSRVYYVRIGEGAPYSPKQIDDGRVAEPDDELFYEWEWPTPMKPDDSVGVIIWSRCIKERSDNEVWGCMFPTMGEVTLKLTVLEAMEFGVRGISNTKPVLEIAGPDPISKTWKMAGPLLRHNSIVFWWRIPKDGGEDVVSPALDFSGKSPTETGNSEPRGLVRSFMRLISRSHP